MARREDRVTYGCQNESTVHRRAARYFSRSQRSVLLNPARFRAHPFGSMESWPPHCHLCRYRMAPAVCDHRDLEPRGLDSLIRDYCVHSRMLIAVPALLIAEFLMELRFSMVMRYLGESGLLDAADLALVDDTIATLVRIRHSFLPELTVMPSFLLPVCPHCAGRKFWNTAFSAKCTAPSFTKNGSFIAPDMTANFCRRLTSAFSPTMAAVSRKLSSYSRSLNVVGPRNMVHCWSTDKDDATDMPRWGKVGKQKIEDAGPLYPKRMETVDDEIRDLSIKFIDKAKSDNKPFFVWLNPTRMHIVTHLSPKYEALRNSENGWSEEEAGMAQLDDDVGIVMDKLKAIGEDENTIVLFTTDNGTEVFTWPDGGQTPFAQSKGTILEGGFRVPAILRWPGHVPAAEMGKRMAEAEAASKGPSN
jgi:hypothetical protein